MKSNADAPAGAVNAVAVPVPTSTIESVCSAVSGGGGFDPSCAGCSLSLPSVLIATTAPATMSTTTRAYTAARFCATRRR